MTLSPQSSATTYVFPPRLAHLIGQLAIIANSIVDTVMVSRFFRD